MFWAEKPAVKCLSQRSIPNRFKCDGQYRWRKRREEEGDNKKVSSHHKVKDQYPLGLSGFVRVLDSTLKEASSHQMILSKDVKQSD